MPASKYGRLFWLTGHSKSQRERTKQLRFRHLTAENKQNNITKALTQRFLVLTNIFYLHRCLQHDESNPRTARERHPPNHHWTSTDDTAACSRLGLDRTLCWKKSTGWCWVIHVLIEWLQHHQWKNIQFPTQTVASVSQPTYGAEYCELLESGGISDTSLQTCASKPRPVHV